MKSNFSTPGFLWPLLTLICIVVILYGLNKSLRKTQWTKQKELKIFFRDNCYSSNMGCSAYCSFL